MKLSEQLLLDLDLEGVAGNGPMDIDEITYLKKYATTNAVPKELARPLIDNVGAQPRPFHAQITTKSHAKMPRLNRRKLIQ